ncbi:MAG: hypothetical protein CFE21_13320 [Bacteroidetes bacterium B1(2017)]|nr:MAG: hypothetical protein CFE21_13320 [Bacteroidetes bacterium B1(2017)]
MAQSIQQKLKLKPNQTILQINAPINFEESISPLPEGISFHKKISNPSQIHWFVKSQGEIKKQVVEVIKQLAEGTVLWIYFPKGSSGIQTDLTRDLGWELVLNPSNNLSRLTLISFDETWSAFAFRKMKV